MKTIKYYIDVFYYALAFIGFLGLITATGFMIGTFLSTIWRLYYEKLVRLLTLINNGGPLFT